MTLNEFIRLLKSLPPEAESKTIYFDTPESARGGVESFDPANVINEDGKYVRVALI